MLASWHGEGAATKTCNMSKLAAKNKWAHFSCSEEGCLTSIPTI